MKPKSSSKARTASPPRSSNFNTLAADAQKDIDEAVNFSMAADKAFQGALTELKNQTDAVRAMELNPEDPLLKFVTVPDNKAIFQLNKAAAKEEFGRAILMGMTSENLQTLVGTSMAIAHKAAKMPAAAAAALPRPTNIPKRRSPNLTKPFASPMPPRDGVADRLPHQVARPDAQVRRTALHGIYSATGSNDDKVLTNAQAAAKAAHDLNPFLSLNSLASDTSAPAPKTPQ